MPLAPCLNLLMMHQGPPFISPGGWADVVHASMQVSSRRVLSAILARYGVPEASVGPVSVVVDKMEKIPLEKVRAVCSGGRLSPGCFSPCP